MDSPKGIYWITGLSGSGKTTLSQAVAERLLSKLHNCVVFDGDQMRQGLCVDLGFSPQDRNENIRRVAEVARLFAQQNYVCLCALITPYTAMRDRLRQRLGNLYHEVYLSCPIATCIERDPKHNYRKAKDGIIQHYTGLVDPYEPPINPDLLIKTDQCTIEVGATTILEYILKQY